jgi:hypothetical protein
MRADDDSSRQAAEFRANQAMQAETLEQVDRLRRLNAPAERLQEAALEWEQWRARARVLQMRVARLAH